MSRRSIVMAALLVTSTGCEEESIRYEYLTMFERQGSPGAEVDPGGVFVPQAGLVVMEVKAKVSPSDAEVEAAQSLELSCDEPSIAKVRKSIESYTWVANGLAPGRANIVVRFEGEVVETIPLVVGE